MGILFKLTHDSDTQDPDDYGTMNSAGAKAAQAAEANRRYKEESPAPTAAQAMYDEPTRKKQREAVSQERREGRMSPKGDNTKYAKGGRVRSTGYKGYGISKKV